MHRHSITQILNLPQYKVTSCKESEPNVLDIWVEPHKRKPFVCSVCGKVHKGKVNSFKEVIAEDLSITGKRVYLHVKKRRMRCLIDLRLHVEKVDWLKPRSRVTSRLAKEVYRLTSITTNQEAGWYLGMNDEKVYRIDREKLEELYQERLVPSPSAKYECRRG